MSNGGIQTLDDALKAVAQVGPIAREYAQKAEEGRELPAEVVDAIAEAGLWAAFAPKAVGGGGLMGLIEQFEITRAMAYEDTSAAWALFICGTGSGLVTSRTTDGGRADFCADGIHPMAGVFNPGGSAEPADGGFVVSGRWPFASGVTYARWVLANTIQLDASGVPLPGAGGLPELLAVVVPRDEVTIVDDWHVAGLRGTGSMTFVLDKVFVPTHRTASFLSPADLVDEPKYRLPLFSLLSPCFAGIAVGLAERALDEVIALLPTKVGPPTFQPASEDAAIQAELGKALAAIRGARESSRAILGRYDARVAAGDDPASLTTVERTEIHQHVVWAAGTCAAAVTELFRLGGASSIYEPGVLQRVWRDIHVLNQHVFLRAINHQYAARAVLGMEVTSPLV